MTKKVYRYCLRCGRKLTTLETMEIGMGATCQKKSKKDKQQKRLFNLLEEEKVNDGKDKRTH